MSSDRNFGEIRRVDPSPHQKGDRQIKVADTGE